MTEYDALEYLSVLQVGFTADVALVAIAVVAEAVTEDALRDANSSVAVLTGSASCRHSVRTCKATVGMLFYFFCSFVQIFHGNFDMICRNVTALFDIVFFWTEMLLFCLF